MISIPRIAGIIICKHLKKKKNNRLSSKPGRFVKSELLLKKILYRQKIMIGQKQDMNWNSVKLLTDHFHKHAKSIIGDTTVIQVQKWPETCPGDSVGSL